MSAGGAASCPSGKRSRMRSRVCCAPASGNCTPRIPASPQAMPQQPMAVSNNAKKGVSVGVRM